MLRGEGNWKTLGLHASHPGRILSTVDALLNCVPFWFQVRRQALPPCLTDAVVAVMSNRLPSDLFTAISFAR